MRDVDCPSRYANLIYINSQLVKIELTIIEDLDRGFIL